MMRILLIMILLAGSNLLAQESNTSIGFTLSPNFSSVMYHNNGNVSEDALESIKSSTEGQVGISGSAFFQYELSEKFLVTWGIGIQNYRSARLSNSIDDPNFSLTESSSQSYLQIAGSIKYRIIRTFYARAGVGADLLMEARLKTFNSNGVSYKGDDPTNFKEAMVPVTLATGYELKLSDRLHAVGELFGTMIVSDALYTSANSSVLQRKPWQLGVSIGVIRAF